MSDFPSKTDMTAGVASRPLWARSGHGLLRLSTRVGRIGPLLTGRPESPLSFLGGRDETSSPAFSESRRGRCRAAGSLAHRAGPSLSDAAGAHDRGLSSGWGRRLHSAPYWSMAIGATWPTVCR